MKMKQLIKAEPNSQHLMIKRTRFHSEQAHTKISKTQKQLETNIRNIIAKDKPSEEDISRNGLPKQQQYPLEEKIWKFFQQKIQRAQNKVDKEKVNIWGQQINMILSETNKKIEHIRKYTTKLQASINSKYKQIHQLHDQILRMKLQRGSLKTASQQFQMPKNFFSQKINLIKENIVEIKSEIQKQGGQIKKAEIEVKKIEDQRENFLRKLLKQGYYRENGIFWTVNALLQLNLTIKNEDLPDILDDNSKLCVMHEIQNIKNSKANQEIVNKRKEELKLPLITKNRVMRSQSQQKMKDMQLKEVYQLAKNYVGDKIRNRDWNRDTIELLAQEKNEKIEQKYRWRENQKKRIYFCYPQERAREVYRLLFGTKLEKIQPV